MDKKKNFNFKFSKETEERLINLSKETGLPMTGIVEKGVKMFDNLYHTTGRIDADFKAKG